jgi:hypothetical protein
VGATPSVTIDGAEHEFTTITAARVPTGENAVLEIRSRELRLFGADGRFVKRIAGPGSGPGEIPGNLGFRLLRSGDSLHVVLMPGMATPSVNTYSVRDGFVSGLPVRAPETPRGGVAPIAPLGPGRWLTMGSGFTVMKPPAAADEVRPSFLEHGVITMGATNAYRRIDSLLVTTFVSYSLPSVVGGFGFANSALVALDVISASADRVWIGNSATGTIRLLNADGSAVSTVPPLAAPRPFDIAKLDAVSKRLQAGLDNADRRARIAAQYSRAARPARAPVFTRFVSGTNGEMWVELYREDPNAAAEFRVLNRDGRTIAAVTMPAGVRVEDVGSDYVLGTIKDADDVPSVVVYRLGRR